MIDIPPKTIACYKQNLVIKDASLRGLILAEMLSSFEPQHLPWLMLNTPTKAMPTILKT